GGGGGEGGGEGGARPGVAQRLSGASRARRRADALPSPQGERSTDRGARADRASYERGMACDRRGGVRGRLFRGAPRRNAAPRRERRRWAASAPGRRASWQNAGDREPFGR